MRKINLIVIGIVFIASIVMISFFGMQVKITNGIVPVTKVECINTSDDRSTVKTDKYGKYIEVKWIGKASDDGKEGTILQLYYKVYPDNASTKKVKFILSNRDEKVVKMATDEKGNEYGLLLFQSKCYLDVEIKATDGSGYSDKFVVWVK